MKEEKQNKTNEDYKFLIEKLFAKILGGRVSPEEYNQVFERVEHEIHDKPFKVAVIGQSGVGKSTTLNAIFGLENYTANLKEGTTDIIEKIFPMRDGFNLSIYDMPGLNNDIRKDEEYSKLYKEILPGCDVVVYIINAHSRDFGEDCRILKEIVLPICDANAVMDNVILAVNKIDTIGESFAPDDPDYQWDYINNIPSPALKQCIQIKITEITSKLVDENIILMGDNHALNPEQIVFYSATQNFNLLSFLKAITNAGKRGWFWTSTVGIERLGKWSDKRLNL